MSRQLKYDQAQLAILNIIANEGLKPGDKLLSERQMIGRMDCSMITLRAALKNLTAKKIIERKVGRGTIVRQEIPKIPSTGKILFISVNGSDELVFPPPTAAQYMRNYLEARGLKLVFMQVNEFQSDILTEVGSACGIMLHGWLTDAFIGTIRNLGLPLLIVGNNMPVAGVPQVAYDVESCMEMLVRCLIDRGARRIALINAEPSYHIAHDIDRVFRRTMSSAGLRVEEDGVIWMEYHRQVELLDNFLPAVNGYDAIISEAGYYPGILASCFFRHFDLKPSLGVLPLLDDSIRRGNKYMFRASPRVLFGRFRDSVFARAVKLLLEQILHHECTETVLLPPWIDDGSASPDDPADPLTAPVTIPITIS